MFQRLLKLAIAHTCQSYREFQHQLDGLPGRNPPPSQSLQRSRRVALRNQNDLPNEIRLSRGGSVAARCQRYLTAAGSNRTLDRQDETSHESRFMRTPASDRQTA